MVFRLGRPVVFQGYLEVLSKPLRHSGRPIEVRIGAWGQARLRNMARRRFGGIGTAPPVVFQQGRLREKGKYGYLASFSVGLLASVLDRIGMPEGVTSSTL